MTVLDVFTATLTDFFLSLGFIATEVSPGVWRRFWQMVLACAKQNITKSEWLAPMTIFNLDPFHPVVSLATVEVGRYFAPGREKWLQCYLLQDWHALIENKPPDRWIHDMGSWSSRVQDLGFREHSSQTWRRKAQPGPRYGHRLNNLMSFASKMQKWKLREGFARRERTSNGFAHTNAICDDIWSRYQQSGEDASGLEDDEDRTLVA